MAASRRIALLAALLALAACGSDRADTAAVEEFLLDNGLDPALTAAIEDPILVDPNLVGQAHPNTVRPPEAPVQAQYPAGWINADGIPATASPARALCGAELERGTEWARRLPAEWRSYPRGRLTDAAGTDAGGCRLRFVAFHTPDEAGRVIGHYRAAAARAGFEAEQRRRGEDHMLAARNLRADTVVVLVVTPLERGSEVALLLDGGA